LAWFLLSQINPNPNHPHKITTHFHVVRPPFLPHSKCLVFLQKWWVIQCSLLQEEEEEEKKIITALHMRKCSSSFQRKKINIPNVKKNRSILLKNIFSPSFFKKKKQMFLKRIATSSIVKKNLTIFKMCHHPLQKKKKITDSKVK
jgi:hypothetical protein